MKKITNILTAVVVVYLLLCYGEILIKNTRPNPQYSFYNIITTICYNIEG